MIGATWDRLGKEKKIYETEKEIQAFRDTNEEIFNFQRLVFDNIPDYILCPDPIKVDTKKSLKGEEVDNEEKKLSLLKM
jgi:hypothetical protein